MAKPHVTLGITKVSLLDYIVYQTLELKTNVLLFQLVSNWEVKTDPDTGRTLLSGAPFELINQMNEFLYDCSSFGGMFK